MDTDHVKVVISQDVKFT